MLRLNRQQRAAILRCAKAAETVIIPPGRPRDAVSAYVYAPIDDCWWNRSQYGHIPNHECNVACRLIEMQLRRQRCPWTDAGECATARERSVAGTSNDIPACPIHGAYPSNDGQ